MQKEIQYKEKARSVSESRREAEKSIHSRKAGACRESAGTFHSRTNTKGNQDCGAPPAHATELQAPGRGEFPFPCKFPSGASSPAPREKRRAQGWPREKPGPASL